jgi:hypothetical protein
MHIADVNCDQASTIAEAFLESDDQVLEVVERRESRETEHSGREIDVRCGRHVLRL